MPLTILYLSHCPYCLSLKRAITELTEQNPAYRAVPVTWIEEALQPTLADKYDYWYVPSVFMGAEKLFESQPSDNYTTLKAAMEQAFLTALAAKA